MTKTYKTSVGGTIVNVYAKGKEYTFKFKGFFLTLEDEEKQKLLERSHLFGRTFSVHSVEGEPKKKVEAPKPEPKPEVVEEKVEEKVQKSEVVVVEEVTTVQQAARYLCDHEGVGMREVNNASKVAAVAKEKGYSFPNLKKK